MAAKLQRLQLKKNDVSNNKYNTTNNNKVIKIKQNCDFQWKTLKISSIALEKQSNRLFVKNLQKGKTLLF